MSFKIKNNVLAKNELLCLKSQQPPPVAAQSKIVEFPFWFGLNEWDQILLRLSPEIWTASQSLSPYLFEQLLDWCFILSVFWSHPEHDSQATTIWSCTSNAVGHLHCIQLSLVYQLHFLCWQSDVMATTIMRHGVFWTCLNRIIMTLRIYDVKTWLFGRDSSAQS